MATTQISAHVSTTTKHRLDDLARITGRSRQSILEDAIARESLALEQIPEEFLIPARIVLDEEAARRLLEVLDHPRPPTDALRRAMKRLG